MIYGEDEYIPYISVFHPFYFTRIYQGNALIGTTVQVIYTVFLKRNQYNWVLIYIIFFS